MIDTYLVYKFIKKISEPFTAWSAYKTGVIDEHGTILVPKKDRSIEQKQSFSLFDVLILNLKRLLGKLPYGKTNIASYLAALWLIKEYKHFSSDSILTEEHIFESEKMLEDFSNYYTFYITEVISDLLEDEGGVPTVNVGSGDIAGLGVGPQGEPGLTKTQMHRHKQNTKKFKPRQIISTNMQESETLGDELVGLEKIKKYARHYRIKKHPIPTEKL